MDALKNYLLSLKSAQKVNPENLEKIYPGWGDNFKNSFIKGLEHISSHNPEQFAEEGPWLLQCEWHSSFMKKERLLMWQPSYLSKFVDSILN